MLGWEFPPLLTGGLGIACYGLSKALADYADLTVIVPRSDPDFKISKFELIGLNHIRLEDAGAGHMVSEQRTSNNYQQFATVHEVPVNLDPYPAYATGPGQLYPGMLRRETETRTRYIAGRPLEIKAAEAEALFSDMDVYGPNIMRKVAAYTEVVCNLAHTLEFDIIHAHDWITYAAATRLKRETGKPMVVHVHSLETDRVHIHARNTVYDIELQGMLAADRVLPVSNFTRSNIIDHYGIDAAKISTVYNGIAPVKKFKTPKPVAVVAPEVQKAAEIEAAVTSAAFYSRYSLEPGHVYRSKDAIYKPVLESLQEATDGRRQMIENPESAISNSALVEAGLQAAGPGAPVLSATPFNAPREADTLADGTDLNRNLTLSGTDLHDLPPVHSAHFDRVRTNYAIKHGGASIFPVAAPEEKWVVFLGRVTRQKSPYMMLETARKLVKRMQNVKFFVAGTGDQLDSLKDQVHLEGLDNYFIFTGFISKVEVGLLLSRADVYFMPSISEPFGLSAVEAAQFDVPCVISKQSGVAELLTHALKANFWDTDKFSDLLYAVLNFDGIRETIVGHTRNDLEQITWQHAARTVSEIYTQLIS